MAESQKNQSNCNQTSQTEVFGDYAGYYDLLYKDKDYASEVEYVAGLTQKFHPSAASILELGSGTGIHASLLAEMGFEVQGIERSSEMLARSHVLSNSKSADRVKLTFSQGDIREIRLGKFFDAVIALFHVISYQSTNDDVTAAFETARYHLNTGGIFIFDVWYGPAVLKERPAVRVKRMANDKIEVTRLAEPIIHPNENRVDVHYNVFVRNLATRTVSELKETHPMRYFFKPEIELVANQTGFRCLHAEEWLSGKPAGDGTWGVCFILQAR